MMAVTFEPCGNCFVSLAAAAALHIYILYMYICIHSTYHGCLAERHLNNPITPGSFFAAEYTGLLH